MKSRNGEVRMSEPMQMRKTSPQSEVYCTEYPPPTSFGTVQNTKNGTIVGPFIGILWTVTGKYR